MTIYRHREEVLNTVLAKTLHEYGVDASPETINTKGKEKPDVIFAFRGLRCVIEGKYADVAAGANVLGVVFEFDAEEKGVLDRAEGVGHGYHEEQVNVLLLDGKLTRVFTYVADAGYVYESLRPYTWYKDFVISGAKEHGLPVAYADGLQAQESVTDHDPARDGHERAKVV